MQAIFATVFLNVACILVAKIMIYCVMLSHIVPIPDRFDDILNVPHDQVKPCPQEAGAGMVGVTVVTGCRKIGRCAGKLWRHLSPWLRLYRSAHASLARLQHCNDTTINCTKHVPSTSQVFPPPWILCVSPCCCKSLHLVLRSSQCLPAAPSMLCCAMASTQLTGPVPACMSCP